MKQILGFLMAAMAVSAADPWLGPRFELDGTGALVIPTGDNDSDLGGVMEFKGRYWLTSRIGLGVSFGFGGWSLEEEVTPPYALPDLEDDDATVSLSTLPMGASVYLRPVVGNRLALNLEAGVRYLYVSDDIQVALDGETEIEDDDITINISHDGDADDAWQAVFAADVELKVTEQFFVGLGAGYQLDLSDQEYRLWDQEPRDLSFDGVVLRATLGLRF